MSESSQFISRISLLTSVSGIFILTLISLSWDASRAVFVVLGLFALFYYLATRTRLTREQKIFCIPIFLYLPVFLLLPMIRLPVASK